ncbi:hypothetical protein W97_00900 [Coniosporium apollinis CBS 100218]|uniref:Uncharacterized protein n=1 Tax=Coniosporium apollinis (strain CBS 100218) TaxID=1168221 RepID=R7YIS1_CONA1|nr:uncharacterized protein W97_00900 [Coniosporium apollinis CBS 100218]EON61684.1 hypothetical protein W97_00900 [Coniosporium apollinis CBS 100218]
MGELKYRSVKVEEKEVADSGPTVSSLLQKATLNDTQLSSSAYFLWSKDATLEALRTLSVTDVLVLFTPVIPPPPGGSSQSSARDSGQDQAMDPFEPLGRALSKYHRRIRHVPYVPAVGMTQTHMAFLQHAKAVVVVFCRGAMQAEDSVSEEGQLDFAQTACDEASGGGVPALVVMVAGDEADTECVDFCETVLCSFGYTPDALCGVADYIFGKLMD